LIIRNEFLTYKTGTWVYKVVLSAFRIFLMAEYSNLGFTVASYKRNPPLLVAVWFPALLLAGVVITKSLETVYTGAC
jgi:hypothetical protein